MSAPEWTAVVCAGLILLAQWIEDWRQRQAALVLKRGCDKE